MNVKPTPNSEAIHVKPLYKIIASAVGAFKNCEGSGNDEWRDRHEQKLQWIAKNLMPSGSGWDLGTKLDLDKSDDDKLVFYGEWHHMNSNGFYTNWTAHRIIVTPSFVSDIDVEITGRNQNQIKDVIHDLFYWTLKEVVDDKLVCEAAGIMPKPTEA